jgi:hypothetical protein
MIQNIRYLIRSERLRIFNLIEDCDDRFRPDPSSYAKGRQGFWIGGEPHLSTTHLRWVVRPEDAEPAPALEAAIKQAMGDFDLFLICRGDIGIKPHRDSSYAAPIASAMNLGRCDAFFYAPERQSREMREFHPKDGAIWEFGSKHLHSSARSDPDAYAIFGWHLSDRFRAI